MSLYDGISVETAPMPEISQSVKKKDEGMLSVQCQGWTWVFHRLSRFYNANRLYNTGQRLSEHEDVKTRQVCLAVALCMDDREIQILTLWFFADFPAK